MSAEEIKNLATDYMQIWSAGNEGLLDRLADSRLIAQYTHFEKAYQGLSAYKSMLKMTYHFFPDLQVTIKNIIPNEQENNATIFWKYQGTHKNGNLFGVESSGREVSVDGMTLLQMENGVVSKEEGIVDNLSLIMQLGVVDQ